MYSGTLLLNRPIVRSYVIVRRHCPVPNYTREHLTTDRRQILDCLKLTDCSGYISYVVKIEKSL